MHRLVSITLSLTPLLAADPSIAARLRHPDLAQAPASGAQVILVRGGMGGGAMGGMGGGAMGGMGGGAMGGMGAGPMGGMMTNGMSGGSMTGSSLNTMFGDASDHAAGPMNPPDASTTRASRKHAHNHGKKAEPCSWWCRLTR